MENITNAIDSIENMGILEIGIRIVSIMIVAKILVHVLTSKSSWIRKLQEKMNMASGKDKSKMNSEFLSKIAKTIIYTIAVFLIIQELGFDLGGLITGLGLGGVILTLAAQDTAKNLFGGVVIFLDKPFKVGDYIEANTYSGTVEDITFRSTAIRTLDDSLLHIPNSEMSAVAITNWAEINRRRYKTNLLITLETPLEKVEKVKQEIKNMLSEQEEIFSDTIMVNFENILDNGIEVVIIAYSNIINYGEFIKLKERLNYQIMQILSSNSVDLAYNTQTVYVKK
jgi:MscS family membrane protein